jgi:hypothetical protein
MRDLIILHLAFLAISLGDNNHGLQHSLPLPFQFPFMAISKKKAFEDPCHKLAIQMHLILKR